MRFRYLILLISLLLVSQRSFCQKKDKDVNGYGTPTNLGMAKFQINDVKKRGVIVRLKTNKDRIAAYRKAGNIKVADKMTNDVIETNNLLMMSFITHWTYCPFYFMESQNTNHLLQHDTLIAKTYDLLRDTAIYMNPDSIYFIDYGTLMTNEHDGDNTTSKNMGITEESNNPASEECLVVKNGMSDQLQGPFPYFAKVSFLNLDKRKSENPDADYHIGKFNYVFLTLPALIKVSDKTRDQKDTINKYLSISYNYILKNYTHGKFPNSVGRLNNKFIDYYCSRLDKDKNILCNDDPYYWWQRNPNIPYLRGLPKLEKKFKDESDKDPQFIRTY
jgi:hypothetical protein